MLPALPPPIAPRDHVLDRIAKLLALAGSPNEHEAQAAMSAAQRLMLKHNIETAARRQEALVWLPPPRLPSGRIGESERLLAAILADHFFVEVIWVPVWRPLEGRRGSVLEVCGIARQSRARGVRARIRDADGRAALARVPAGANGSAAGATASAFLPASMSGFRDKSGARRKKNGAEGLVWQGRRELHGFFRKPSPAHPLHASRRPHRRRGLRAWS